MIKKDRYTNTLLGVKLDCIRKATVLKKVTNWLTEDKKRYIVTPNPEMLVEVQKDERFKQVLNSADMAILDGTGLVWALRMRGVKNIERVAGADLMIDLVKKANQYRKKVFLLGGYAGVAESAKRVLVGKYPKLRIQAETGPIDITKTSKKQDLILRKKINAFKPDLLLVAFGHQKQEKWIAKNLKYLNVKVAMGVGGSFDYLVDSSLRAPKFMQVLGFEWLWRLFRQPWRIKRQLSLVKFIWLVLACKESPCR